VRVLLDTCTFLWLAASPDRISDTAKAAIDDAGNNLLLSDVSVWEIATKHRIGKLPLPQAPRSWVSAQMSFFQLDRLPIDIEAIYLSGELPLIHRDPFDRLLAAQAQGRSLTVLTPDEPFQALGADVLW
jgi:PIN domain nuclease of toxin-antitoxin system